MEDLNREERVKLPEGWNSYNKTWITKDGFKDQKGKEITDIDDKIKKFIELLDKVKVSEIKGGVTNFCFRFPDIVKNVFGTECKLQKGGLFKKGKSTNPFDHQNFCDTIFDFIDKNSGSEDAKKQNYCLLFEMIFMTPGFIGYDDDVRYDSTLENMKDHILYIFTQKTWTHMPIISSMFMEKLCLKITNTDIEKYNFKFVLKAKNDDQEISKYGSIVINGADIQKIKTLNKLKLLYYKALLNNKFNPNKSKDFFYAIDSSLTDFGNNHKNAIDLIIQINQYTNVNNLQNNKQILRKLESIPNNIEKSNLSDQSKLIYLDKLFDIIADLLQRTDDKKPYLQLALNGMKCMQSMILKIITNDECDIDGYLERIYNVAVLIDPDQAYQKISDLFILVAPSCHVDIFTSLLTLLRGDAKQAPNKYYLNAISSVARKLANDENINQAKDKLSEFVEFISTDPKKNISSDIFQSLFNAINKHFPMLKGSIYNSDDFITRCNLLTQLFHNFAETNPKAEEAYFEKVKTIMDEYQKFLNDNKSQIPFSLYNRQNFANSLIKIVVKGRSVLSHGEVKYQDVVQIVDIIAQSFPSDQEDDKKYRHQTIAFLFDLLSKYSLLNNFLGTTSTAFVFSSGVKVGLTAISNGLVNTFTFKDRPRKQPTDFLAKETKILSYREILPDEINNTVDDYNKKLKKEQVNEKFDLDAQVFRDIGKDVIQERLFELNKIINNNAPEQENPLIGIFRFLSDKQFNLDQFLYDFQDSYLNTVVDLIKFPISILDKFINKHDVTNKPGKLFDSKNKNASENDQFNQKLAYNSRLKDINKLIIKYFIQQQIEEMVNYLFNDILDDKGTQIQKTIDELSQKITSSLLKKFGSIYGLISKIQTVAKNVGKNGAYNTTASAIFDFILDFINDKNDQENNLLSLLLKLVSHIDEDDINLNEDTYEDTYKVISFFMGLITFSKALDCDTEILANNKNTKSKTKTTGKLMDLLRKIVGSDTFQRFVEKLLGKEYVNKFKQLIDDVAKLKFEDCAYLLCSDQILLQNKENEESEKDENYAAVNRINIIIESKLDIILNQTAMFSWLRKNQGEKTNSKTTFFDLVKSLSDNNKIQEFEKYKKEQIAKNREGQTQNKEQKKMDNIESNNNINLKNEINLDTNEIKECTKLNNYEQLKNDITTKDSGEKNLHDNKIKDELNYDNDDINEIKMDINIEGDEVDKNKREENKKNDNTLQSKNESKVENNNMKIDVDVYAGNNNQYELVIQNIRVLAKGRKKPERKMFELYNDNDVCKEVNNMNVKDKVKKNEIIGDQDKQNENNEIKNKDNNDKKLGKKTDLEDEAVKNVNAKTNNNIENNVNEIQKTKFASINDLFNRNKAMENENENIDNKKRRKRQNSSMFTNEPTFDNTNQIEIVNQIKPKENNNTKNNNVIENSQNIINNTESEKNTNNIPNINLNNDNQNNESLKNITENIRSKFSDEENNYNNNTNQKNENNNQIEEKENKYKLENSKHEINMQIKNDSFNINKSDDNIKNQDKKSEDKDINAEEQNNKNKNLNLDDNYRSNLGKRINPEIKKRLSLQLQNIYRNSTELSQQSQNIQTTKSTNKKKTIFAIIFSIIFMLSTVLLTLALTVEALNFLALVISMAVVTTVTIIIMIVLIVSIYESNKISEQNTTLENPDKPAAVTWKERVNLSRKNNDKTIRRCQSLNRELPDIKKRSESK